MSFLTLYKADWKMTRRDPILVYAIMMVFVMMFLIRFFKGRIPSSLYFGPVIFSLLLIPMIFGMMPAFLMLDEKEEKIVQALHVVPISTFKFLTYRLLNGMIFTGIFTVLAPIILDIKGFSNNVWIMLMFLLVLEVPILALFVINFANSRIQGMTIVKFIGWFLLLPIVIEFIVVARDLSTDWTKFTAFLPTYWISKFYEEVLSGGEYAHYFRIGFVVHLIWILALGIIFKKKIL